MPLHRWLRTSAAPYTLPLAIVYLYVLLNGESKFLEDNFLAATILSTSSAVLALAPPCAALGAWEAFRLRQAGIDVSPTVRRRTTVLLASSLPIVGTAALGLVLAFAFTLLSATGRPTMLDVQVIVIALLVIVAWTMAGFAAGRFLHPAVGVPVLLLGTWLWLAYPRAVEPLWLRHVPGSNLTVCCDTDKTIDMRALNAQSLLACGILAGAYFLWGFRGRPWNALPPLALPAVSGVVAALIVHGMGADAQRPRADHGLVCATRQNVEICVWRERVARLDQAARLTVPAARRVAAAIGRPMPRRLTEGRADQSTVWSFKITPESSDTDVLFSLATGFLPAEPPKSCPDTPGGSAYTPLGAWLAVKAHVDRDLIAQKVGPDTVALVKQVLARPEAVQRDWFARNRRALTTCGIEPFEVGSPAARP